MGYGTLSIGTWLPTDLRRALPSLSGSLLSKNIAPTAKIEAESSETSVAIYRWHGLISENNGISNLSYEPSHCTDFCSLCYLPPRFQATLFSFPHPYKTAGKTIVVFYIFRTLHLRIIMLGNQSDAQFLLWYVYLNPLHVSSNCVLIRRRTFV